MAENPDLKGLFVHILNEKNLIRFQGQIISAGDKYALIQLFSYADGRPTNLTRLDLDFLFSDKCRVYQYEDEWKLASERDSEKRRELSEAAS